MNVLIRLPWLLVLIPIAEIYILIQVGQQIGAPTTILLVIFTAVLGIHLIRYQGLSTFRRVQTMVDHGEMPALELLEGLVLLIAGAFLLTPGFLTDSLAFLALVTPLRRRVLRAVIAHGIVAAAGEPADVSEKGGAHTIEGEFRRHDD